MKRRTLKDCMPGERVRMSHVDDVVMVLELGEGLEELFQSGLLIPVVSVETWKVCMEPADTLVYPEEDDDEL